MDLNTEDATYITNDSVTLQNSVELATVSPSTAFGCQNHGQYIIGSHGDHRNIQYWTNTWTIRLLICNEIRL